MRKTYPQRILNYLITQEQEGNIAWFHRKIATQRFPKVRNRGYDAIHGIVMRTARRMNEHSLLKRIAPGIFILSDRGRRVAE